MPKGLDSKNKITHKNINILLDTYKFPKLSRKALDILQVNLGYKCNLRCRHCHVNAGPNRKEMMNEYNISLVIEALKARSIKTLDLTGGAPELNVHFRDLVSQARKLGVNVIDRCNLTILYEPGQEGLAEFLAENQVEVVASLPCYSLENVDKQRGDGVFDKSIDGLKLLNRLGYGKKGSNLVLDLVYNPMGASLPPSQSKLEEDYKIALKDNFDIEFNNLYTITNMPIQRFANSLLAKKQFSNYMQLLIDNYSPSNLASVMCLNTLSVDWQGFLYDCDFNQQLNIGLQGKSKFHLRDLLLNDFIGNGICVSGHCFGCTAGQGSSCTGSL